MKTTIVELLGKDAEYLLNHQCTTVSKELLHTPGPDFVDRVIATAPGHIRPL